MTKLDYKNKKHISIHLIKMLKSDDFFNQLDEFDNIFNQAKININQIVDKKRLTNFLEYAMSDYNKFFYLVEKYQANYHTVYSNEDYSSTASMNLLDQVKILNTSFTTFDKTFEEEKKILEKLKEDKYTWLDETFTSFLKDEKKVLKKKNFFDSFFIYHQVEKKDIEHVMTLSFTEKEKQNRLDYLKHELLFTLLEKCIFHYNRFLSHQNRISPVVNLEVILPTLKENNLIIKNDERLKHVITNMFSNQVELHQRKQDSLAIIKCLLTNDVITSDFLNSIDFSQIYLNHLFEKVDANIYYHKENKKQYKYGYDEGYISYPPTIFESTLSALDELEKMGVHAYVPKESKSKLLDILAIMEGSVDVDMPRSLEQRKYKQYSLMKELITLKQESINPNVKLISKKVKI